MASNLVGYYPAPVRQHVLRYEIYAPAWVEPDNQVVAQLYGDQLPALEPDERASFSPTAEPDAARDVRLAGMPAQRWDRSTSLVRFAFEAWRRSAARGHGGLGEIRAPPAPDAGHPRGRGSGR